MAAAHELWCGKLAPNMEAAVAVVKNFHLTSLGHKKYSVPSNYLTLILVFRKRVVLINSICRNLFMLKISREIKSAIPSELNKEEAFASSDFKRKDKITYLYSLGVRLLQCSPW